MNKTILFIILLVLAGGVMWTVDYFTSLPPSAEITFDQKVIKKKEHSKETKYATSIELKAPTPQPSKNEVKVENSKTTIEKPREQPKPTETSTPAATATKKDNSNDLTPLKKEADKLIKELKNLGVDITVFEKWKNTCENQACLTKLITVMKNEKQKL
jgi:hypothetical protein